MENSTANAARTAAHAGNRGQTGQTGKTTKLWRGLWPQGLAGQVLLIAGAALLASRADAADLTIAVNDVRDTSGQIMLRLLASEAEMAGRDSQAAAVMLQARDGVRVTLHDLPAGTYGVQVMHDVNGNGELDTNVVGMPREPWAFSNNAKGRLGPPKWKDVSFEIGDQNVTQAISLNH
ncbi:MAG: DUF2141 domain-containing protein [Pseudomonadota bacterium]